MPSSQPSAALAGNPIWRWQAYLAESVFHRPETYEEAERMWRERASAYHRSRRNNQSARKAARLVASWVGPDQTVIEVGPGSGLFTAALAQRARHVTAVEFSPAAATFLGDQLAREGRTNVTLLNELWEQAVVGPADFVVAAGCLHAFWDIATALTRMAFRARREVVLVEDPNEGVSGLERALCRLLGVEPPRFSPPVSCLLEVIEHLGYEPAVQVLRGVHGEWYPSVGVACQKIARRLELPRKVPLAYVRGRLKPHLRPGSRGGVFLEDRGAATAVIRFAPQEGQPAGFRSGSH